MPQRAHGIVRAGVPAVQSQSVGAVQAAHSPAVQISTPAPQAPLHGRSALSRTVGSVSSQSSAVDTPSPSASMAAIWHRPEMQTSGEMQAGSQPELPESVRPASRRVVEGGEPPFAHPRTKIIGSAQARTGRTGKEAMRMLGLRHGEGDLVQCGSNRKSTDASCSAAGAVAVVGCAGRNPV